jgi:hypothetical protein
MHELWQLIKNYLETRLEIIEIDVQDHLQSLIGKLIKLLLIGFFGVSALFFLFFGVAWSLSLLFKSFWVGFGVVSLIFANILVFLLSPLSGKFWEFMDQTIQKFIKKN